MKFFRISVLVTLVATAIGWTGCNQDPDVETGSATIYLRYVVGTEDLVINQFNYTTLAGNSYSVTDMRYILSDFTFHKTDGGTVKSDAVFYADARRPDTDTLNFSDIESTDYDAISFVIGLQPDLNVTNGLPNEIDFNDMSWPIGMGGGYHFMRFEGHFMHSTDGQMGIAWHLGRNLSLMPFNLDHTYTVSTSETNIGTLTMDLDRYFDDPVTFDLDTTGFAMSNQELMAIMAANTHDVFSID